jgi:signal transduction histidine kinase
LQVSAETARNVRHFLAEAASNAVRHGKASQINVDVKATSNRLHLTVADNGLGFKDLHGSYSGEELSAGNVGPFSLRTRANDMGGVLTLQTSSSGTRIQVEVPL